MSSPLSAVGDLSCLKEELRAYPDCKAYIVKECGEISDAITNPYPDQNLLAPTFGDYNFDDARFLSFRNDCELHKTLGPTSQKESNEYLWDSSFFSGKIFRDLFDGIEPLSSAKGGEAEYLLQSVVGHVYDGFVDIANRYNRVMTSTGQIPGSSRPRSAKGDSTPLSRHTSAFVRGAKNNLSSKFSVSFKSTVSTVTDNENLGKDCYYAQSRKVQKQSSVSKRKARPGDNPRPKLRDRKMIQDPLKKLRELVANGTKYNIEALLGQTIKHMLYLRSVTNQAEKFSQWAHHEAPRGFHRLDIFWPLMQLLQRQRNPISSKI